MWVFRRLWPLYFPTLLLVKTPLWELALLLGAVFSLVNYRRRTEVVDGVMLAVTAVLLGLLVTSRLNMGIRHAMPQVFLVAVATALLLRWPLQALRATSARRRVARLLLFGMASWALLTLYGAGPRYLGSFNAFLSRTEGARLAPVGDDWGQDLTALASTVTEEKLAPLYYFDTGHTRRYELEFLGVKARPVACKARFRTDIPGTIYIAIHVVDLQLLSGRCFPWRAQVGRTQTINDHIVVHELHFE